MAIDDGVTQVNGYSCQIEKHRDSTIGVDSKHAEKLTKED